jgi:hypothetical protein
MRWQPLPQQGGFLPAEEPSQLAEDLDQAVGVVVAGRDVKGELGAAAVYALAEGGRHRGLLQLDGCVKVGGWPRGAQLRPTFGVRLSADSSKKTRQALRRWVFAESVASAA